MFNPQYRYLRVYVKNFYLNNTTKNKEYCKITINLIPQEIIDKYDLPKRKIDVYVYYRVVKLMYGLEKSGIIAHEALK